MSRVAAAGLELVGMRVPGIVRAGGIDPTAVETEEAVQEAPHNRDQQRRRTKAAEQVRAERSPEPYRQHRDEHAGEIRADLVVDPGAVRGDGPEVGDVVASGAVGAGLGEPARHPADGGCDQGEQTADAGNAREHPADHMPPGRSRVSARGGLQTAARRGRGG